MRGERRAEGEVEVSDFQFDFCVANLHLVVTKAPVQICDGVAGEPLAEKKELALDDILKVVER